MNKNRYKIVLFFLSYLLCFACKDKGSDSQPAPTPDKTEEKEKWVSVSLFPGISRKEASSFAIGDKLYIGLGMGSDTDGHKQLKDFWEYNTTSNIWTRKADFGGGATRFGLGFSINDKGYIALGNRLDCPALNTPCDHIMNKDIWEYTPGADSWKKVATIDDPNNMLSIGGTAFIINNKAYILSRTDLWEFDPATYSLTPKTKIPETMHYVASFSIDGKGYVGTGWVGQTLKSFYEYDPMADKWTRKADFAGEARSGAFGFALNRKGFIGNGVEGYSSGKKVYNDCWQYDPASDKWHLVKSYPGLGRLYQTGSVVNGKAYIGTGDAQIASLMYEKDFWVYSPE